MSLIVTKFGGTSVANPERIRDVAARLVDYQKQGNQVLAVVSAMGKATDDLLKLAQSVNPRPPARELDVLLATGEQVSISLLAMAIEALGSGAVSMTGIQAGIVTTTVFNRAKISEINTDRLQRELDDDKIVIVAGFQGVTTKGDITTLGRGGSDTSAVAIAAALGAEVCEIYTDVDGVYTADPRMVPRARKLEAISYDEMLELAAAGSGVLHMRSVEVARNHGVVIHCRSAFTTTPGTLVKEAKDMEQVIISGVAYDNSEAKITIRGVPDQVGIAADLFTAIADTNINIDMIVQNISENGETDISFTSPINLLPRLRTVLDGQMKTMKVRGYVVDESVAKISLVGAGMKNNPGVAAKMFRVLAENGINIDMISTSAIRVSVVIDSAQTQLAMEKLHTAFDLDSDQVFEETQLSDEELAAKAQKGR